MIYEINVFLKRLANIYYHNPNLDISQDTIYSELRSYSLKDNRYEKIPNTDISNIQNRFSQRYNNDTRVHTFNNGYFWVINNIGNYRNNKEFMKFIDNSIKMYISVDESCLEYVASNVFDFIIRNNIVSQGKISKEMRNDALVIRVATLEDVKKITYFINNVLVYNAKIKPNPFLYKYGKVSLAMDGKISYNLTISNIISVYLYVRRSDNRLHVVGYGDFVNFLNNEYKKIYNMSDETYINILNQLIHGDNLNEIHYKTMIYYILNNYLNNRITDIDFLGNIQNLNVLDSYYRCNNIKFDNNDFSNKR